MARESSKTVHLPNGSGYRLERGESEPALPSAGLPDGWIHLHDDPAELVLTVHELGAHLASEGWVVRKYEAVRIYDPMDQTGCVAGVPTRVVYGKPLAEWLAEHALERAHAS